MPSKWYMDECRATTNLEDVQEGPEPEQEPDPRDVHQAQRLAGGLNWLSTRTRPDRSFMASQLSSAATRAPLRAMTLGKKVLRYLAGTRDHGIRMVDHGALRSERSGSPAATLEGFGDAAYEVGYTQTGVLIKYRGMLVITHYQRLLDHIKPDVVHIMADGRIIKSGGPELAHELEAEGYDKYLGEVA